MEFINDKIWTPIHMLPGYECCIEYYVNEHGDVKSTKGQIERMLKQRYPMVNKNGLYCKSIFTQRIGRKKTITVLTHKLSLVALAFLELKNGGPNTKPGPGVSPAVGLCTRRWLQNK